MREMWQITENLDGERKRGMFWQVLPGILFYMRGKIEERRIWG